MYSLCRYYSRRRWNKSREDSYTNILLLVSEWNYLKWLDSYSFISVWKDSEIDFWILACPFQFCHDFSISIVHATGGSRFCGDHRQRRRQWQGPAGIGCWLAAPQTAYAGKSLLPWLGFAAKFASLMLSDPFSLMFLLGFLAFAYRGFSSSIDTVNGSTNCSRCQNDHNEI